MIHENFMSCEDRKDVLNPFQWSHSKLNITGDESYTPKIPWVIKVRSGGHLSSEVFIFVDDGRIIAHS